METFSALLALWEGNSPVTFEFPSQRPVTRSSDFFFDIRLNNRDAGDLRRHHAHYDVTLMNGQNYLACEVGAMIFISKKTCIHEVLNVVASNRFMYYVLGISKCKRSWPRSYFIILFMTNHITGWLTWIWISTCGYHANIIFVHGVMHWINNWSVYIFNIICMWIYKFMCI